MTRLKRALWLILSAVFLVPLGACNIPVPTDVRPAPGDNVIRIEVEATFIGPNGTTTVVETYDSIVINTFNGDTPPDGPKPLVARDGLPLLNRELCAPPGKPGACTSTPGSPWWFELSQAPGTGGGVVAGSLKISSLANSIHRNALVINCRFKVKISPASGGDGQFHPADRFFQTSTGRPVSCLFSFTFQMP